MNARQWLDKLPEVVAQLPVDLVPTLEQIVGAEPDWLNTSSEETPLTVALWGGTGVGKSSLLNALVGADIATTGVLRPTSRNITVYAAPGLQGKAEFLDQFGERLDWVEQTHSNQMIENIIWIDTPDVDSFAADHQRLAEPWLRAVDIAIYVTSPERYRDAKVWSLLQAHCHARRWVLVMNKHDYAEPAVIEDWRALIQSSQIQAESFLTQAQGNNDAGVADLRDYLFKQSLGDTVNVIRREAELRRVQGIRQTLKVTMAQLERQACDEQAQKALQQEQTGAQDWQTCSQRYAALAAAEHCEPDTTPRLWRWLRPNTTPPPPNVLGNAIAARQNAATQMSMRLQQIVAVDPLTLNALPEPKHVIEQLAKQPPDPLQRGAQWALKLGRWLPLLVVLGASMKLIGNFIGASGAEDYLGLSFLVDTLMLAVIAWALPCAIGHLIRPEPSKRLARALETCDQLWATSLQQAHRDAQLREQARYQAQAKALHAHLQTLADPEPLAAAQD